ncbi:MAG: response regulator [Bacteroidetes bacterium]|nr:response regulator [Bacteroidota bacterium]
MKFSFFVFLLAVGFNAFTQNLKFERIGTNAGLSQSNVTCMLQDRHGFMWFGTRDGLNKYDGYKFTVYRSDEKNENSLSSNFIMDLVEDAKGNLWIGTYGGGLNLFNIKEGKFLRFRHDDNNQNSIAGDYINSLLLDSNESLWVGTDKGLDLFNHQNKTFSHYNHKQGDTRSLSSDYIKDIFEDSNHNLWIGTLEGGLNLFDRAKQTFKTFKSDDRDIHSISSNTVSVIFEDSEKRLWIGTRGGGLNLFNRETQRFKHFKNDPLDKNSVAHNVVISLAQDNQNNLWVGTENGGLSILDLHTKLFDTSIQDDIDKASLTNNSIWSIYKDAIGNMWVGTYSGGINFLNINARKFAHYRHTGSPQSLSHNTVLSIYEDANQNLWIGTDGGGLNLFDRKSGSFRHFLHDQSHRGRNYVLSVIEDHEGNLWMGTWGEGVIVFDRKKNAFHYFKHNPADQASLSSDNAWTIFEDSDKNIWIGTYGGCLDLYDRDKKSFIHFRHNPTNPASISGNHVNTMSEDGKGNLWIGTNGNGLNRLNKQTGVFTHFEHSNSDNSISNNSVNCLYIDTDNKLWIGTDFGLCFLDPDKNEFRNYHISNGLPNETIFGILKGNHGDLWISTNHGIAQFNRAANKFTNFTDADGLQSNEFKPASCKSKNGKMYFGGVNGFNEFHPDSIKSISYEPPLVFTDFKIFNESVPLVKNKGVDNEYQPITLSYKQSVISLEFASLNFTSRERKQYSYFMEGFDKDWNLMGKRHSATYTNLDPGNYVFKVRGMNSDRNWSKNIASIAVTITPPYWRTWWFKVISIIMGVGLVALIFAIRESMIKKQRITLVQQVKERTRQLLLSTEDERKARKEAEKANLEATQANRAKSVFLATMSHELRTPMNGVIGMASLLAQTSLNGEQREYADTIRTCSDSLLGVINDILDYSKIESEKMELEQKDFNLRSSIEEVLDMFAEKAAHTGLDLIYQLDYNVPSQIIGDSLRLRQVLTNLVGNAIKFTKKGEIFIGVRLLKMEGEKCELSFEVRDTGIGIPEDKIDKLFKAFSQVDSSTTRKYGGTGLGLAISEKLIRLMGGNITVGSIAGKGTTFRFTICTSSSVKSLPTYVYCNMMGLEEKTVLVVDDNSTNRSILKTQLEMWKLAPTLASSGEEAIEILSRSNEFDLVITDMQMPGMDGVQLAQAIRYNYPDVPIILLSSLGDERNKKFTGLFSSVLTKPVKQNMLCQHIANALRKMENKMTVVMHSEEKLQADFSEKYPMRILVAEDNPVNQRLAERVLNKLGYTPNMVVTGKEALEAQNKNQYDIILMDVQMPEMDGLEATRKIRSNQNEQPVIIAMTANAMKSDQEDCIQAGMDDYISKPIKLDHLVNLIEKWGQYVQVNKKQQA